MPGISSGIVSSTNLTGFPPPVSNEQAHEIRLLKIEAMIEELYNHVGVPYKKCNLCNQEFRFWELYHTTYRRFVACPHCGSVESHRLLWFYISNNALIPPSSGEVKLLHFAPEKCLRDIFSSNPLIDYYPVDYNPDYPRIKDTVDISNIQYEENFFDLIICNHVLECVPDDYKALRELRRVLTPNGIALVMSAVIHRNEKTLENPDYNTAELRRKHYGFSTYYRLYGSDFTERIRLSGFDVKEVYYAREFSTQEYNQYGLRVYDKIYVLTCNEE